MSDNAEAIIEAVTRGINDESVVFLQGINAYESEYAVEFDLYALAMTKAYWTTRREGGRGGKAVVQYSAELFESWCNTVLDVFRETHADVFACKVIGYTCDDYLEHVSRFADSNPELIATYRDLVRIMVVCEAAFGDTGCSRLTQWVEDGGNCLYATAVRREARALIATTREEPHYRYLLEYGKAVVRSVDERIAHIQEGDESELLDLLQGFASSTQNTAQYLWRFWLYAMRRG